MCSFLLSCECLFLCTFGWSVIATFPGDTHLVFREPAAEQNAQFFIFQSVLVDNWTFSILTRSKKWKHMCKNVSLVEFHSTLQWLKMVNA